MGCCMSADRPNTNSHGKSLRNEANTHSTYKTGPGKVRTLRMAHAPTDALSRALSGARAAAQPPPPESPRPAAAL